MANPSLSLNDTGRIYLDHNATTAPHKSVLENLSQWAYQWGNPSSIHWSGREPKALIRNARTSVAKVLNCQPLELIFTSCGSESNNLVIKGFFDANIDSARNEYITTCVEHPSVMKSFDYILKRGAVVHYVPVSRNGTLDIEFYEKHLSEKTALVSIMSANNETGSIFPITELAAKARAVGAKFHTDAVQVLGKMPINVESWGVNYATFAAHKAYSLKGTGLVYARKGEMLQSLISGGGQERGRRAGTENTLSIAAFGHIATLLSHDIEMHKNNMTRLRIEMEAEILKRISGVHFTGDGVDRLPNTSSFIVDDIDGESLLINLDMHGVSVSTGAACSSGSSEPSHVLLAMGLTRAEAQRSLRISIGWCTTSDEIAKFLEIFVEVVAQLRRLRSEMG
ncbi:MAG: hypothetical protein A2Z20_05580 [Bdellovibrionales bacterium RBG_16_40_8]|nr:MAG: hypothetical protein A2Z20_05580 [Bdellovibrionales bacterium RBG_16_40_8]